MIIYGKYRKHELFQSTLVILSWLLLFQSKDYEVLVTSLRVSISTILEPRRSRRGGGGFLQLSSVRYMTKFLVSGKRMVVARQKQNFAGDERKAHMG